jgi:hypothetical protein
MLLVLVLVLAWWCWCWCCWLLAVLLAAGCWLLLAAGCWSWLVAGGWWLVAGGWWCLLPAAAIYCLLLLAAGSNGVWRLTSCALLRDHTAHSIQAKAKSGGIGSF